MLFQSNRHSSGVSVGKVGVAATLLLAGLSFSATAHAEPPKAPKTIQPKAAQAESQQCVDPTLQDDLVLRLDPFVSYPWIAMPTFDSEFGYVNAMEHELLPPMYALRPVASIEMGQSLTPQVRLIDKPDHYVLQVSEKGIRPSDVKVDVQGRKVTVRYEKEKTIRSTAASGATTGTEQFESSFAETMDLGSPVQASSVRVVAAGNHVNIVLHKLHQGT